MEDLTRAFIVKTVATGDVTFLKQQIYEMKEDLTEYANRDTAVQKELEELRAEIRELRRVNESLMARGGASGDRDVRRPMREAAAGPARAPAAPVVEKERRAKALRADGWTEARHGGTAWTLDDGSTGRSAELSSSDRRMDRTVQRANVPDGAWLTATRRGKPRVIDDVQLVPPRPLGRMGGFPPAGSRFPPLRPSTSRATPRPPTSGRRRYERSALERTPMSGSFDRVDVGNVAAPEDRARVAARPPLRGNGRVRRKTAVVTITTNDGGSYAEVLRRAREKVSLQELGIHNTKIRRAFNGGIIIEIPGENGADLASVLRDKLAGTLGNDVKVDRPVAKGEVKITGIDPSTTLEEVALELTRVSGCLRCDIKISDIRPLRDGMGIAWATCPLNAAISIAEKGVLHLGWTRARVELLRKRPVQCFRCWRYGHVRQKCDAPEDRAGACFRCGSLEHQARVCNAPSPRCVVCEDASKPSNHRMGSAVCLEAQGFQAGPVMRGGRRYNAPLYPNE